VVRPGRLRPSPNQLRGFAIAALVANIAIVVTGGAVRLTSSGLGCPSWPTCTADSLVPTPEYGIHGLIEYGNRILTFVVASVMLATLVAAYRARPARRDVRRLALTLFLGIPAQGVIGGITVLTHLNPWTVMAHFLLSMVLVGLAAVLVRRTAEGDDPPRPLVHPALRGLALAILGVVAVVLCLGTVVTGSGPHAGDETARRTGLDPETVSQLHADLVFLLVGLSVALVVALAATGVPRPVRVAAAGLVAMELAQGTVGFVQYVTGLPIALVGLHMLGAALVVVLAVTNVLTMRDRGPRPDQVVPVRSARDTSGVGRAAAPLR
jgi:cytochrome c oxidase assembly protein subunit 15